jgi:hypothetical protein
MAKLVTTQWARLGKPYADAEVDGIAYPECPFATDDNMTPLVGDVKCVEGSWCALSNKESRCPYLKNSEQTPMVTNRGVS